jgi:nucleotide-binding universal stress UspA family protein
MFKDILLPIDGSDLSLAAARHGIELAKAIGAAVTAVTVTTPWADLFAREPAVVVPGVLVPEREYEAGADEIAATRLQAVTDAAAGAGVPARALHLRHRDPDVAILEAARQEGSDLIVMASHGRRGLAELLIGSETARVLGHSHMPVLVYRKRSE